MPAVYNERNVVVRPGTKIKSLNGNWYILLGAKTGETPSSGKLWVEHTTYISHTGTGLTSELFASQFNYNISSESLMHNRHFCVGN